MKDAAQDVAKDVTQDVAEDRSVREGAHCGTCRLLAVEPTPNTRMPTPTPALGRHVKDEHVKDAPQNAAEDMPQGVAKDLAFGAFGTRAARALLATPPPPPPPPLRSLRIAEMGAQPGSSVVFGSVCGQALPGCCAKRLYVDLAICHLARKFQTSGK